MFGAVQMRAEAYAFVGDFAKFRQAENLVAARIGENGAGPGHKLMQAAEAANQLMAGTQIKMIGVGQNDFRAEPFKGFLREGLDGGLRADRQKERSLHHAVRRGETAAARAGGAGFQDLKGKTHPPSVSGEDQGPADANRGKYRPNCKGNGERLRAFQSFRVDGGETDGQ